MGAPARDTVMAESPTGSPSPSKPKPSAVRIAAAERDGDRHGSGEPGTDEAEPSDLILVGRARAGETAAFEALIFRYKALVSLVAYRQMGAEDQVDDVAQEAFVKAFLHIGELDDPSRFKAWLLRITANVSLDHLRKRKHDGVSLDQSGAYAAAESAAAKAQGRGELKEADGRVLDGELRAQIVEAIYSLPEEYQVPAAMRYLDEVPYREISQRLGLREETLRKRIHRANQMLRRKLRKLWPEGEEL